MQIHNAATPTRPDKRVLPTHVLLILHVHLLHVFPILLVLVLVVEADDGGTEPCGRAELHGYVAEVLLFGLVLLERGFGHVGATVLEFADCFCCQGEFVERNHLVGGGAKWP